MGKHDKSELDKARDELMSHVIRCDVFEASMEHRMEWLEDTLAFMSERYPQLNELQMAQLEMMGRQFVRPPIPHGSGKNAQTMDRTKLPTTESAPDAPEAGEADEAADGTAVLDGATTSDDAPTVSDQVPAAAEAA